MMNEGIGGNELYISGNKKNILNNVNNNICYVFN